MAVRPASVAPPAPVAGRPFALGRAVEREGVFSWLMLVPGILFLLAFVAYPFFYGIFLRLQERRVASAGTFAWLGNKTLAMVSIIGVNTWRGLPFYGITLLAGLQTISPDLYEAAAIDGASVTQRFRHITLPVLKPVLIIVTMFSVIFTFSDFQLPYVLTHGGPANATHLFATHAFDVGMSAGVLRMGAAEALAMLPALAILIGGLALYLKP